MPDILTSKKYGHVLTGGDIIPSPGIMYVINKNNKIVLCLNTWTGHADQYSEYIPLKRNSRKEWVNCSGEYTWGQFKRKLLNGGIRFELKSTQKMSTLN